MGCCGGKPSPPVDALVGTWATDEKAAAYKTGYGAYRHKRGYFMGLRSDGEERARITIKPSGWVSYVHTTKSSWCTIIDMPVSDWGDETMSMAMGASLKYSFGANGTLVVNGLTLHKRDK